MYGWNEVLSSWICSWTESPLEEGELKVMMLSSDVVKGRNNIGKSVLTADDNSIIVICMDKSNVSFRKLAKKKKKKKNFRANYAYLTFRIPWLCVTGIQLRLKDKQWTYGMESALLC